MFSIDELEARARARQGLDDFGDPSYRRGLAMLAETLDRHVSEPMFREHAQTRLLRSLGIRLRVAAAAARHPQIAQAAIPQPLVLTGLPRTGTSALLNLLASDPDTRALRNWEMRYPDPLEGSGPGDPDPRREKWAARLEAQRAADPGLDAAHYVSADTPEECVILHQLHFDGVQNGFEALLEPYASWYQDPAHALGPMYRYYHSILQMLQWREPKARWLLKAPAHMWAIDALFDTLPDVGVLWGHRDPTKAIPSICSYTEQLVASFVGASPALEPARLGTLVMEFYATSLERGIAARRRQDPARFLDYSFLDFDAEPVRLAERAYQHFGLRCDAQARERLRAHAQANPRGRHGEHRYSAERYGLSDARLRERFDFYMSDPAFRDYL